MRLLAALLLALPDGISNSEFEKLREQLNPKSQPWATVPWKATVTEARQQAAKEGKPIFIIGNTGNALGMV